MASPNILLITSDQQRFDTAGDASPPFMRTPHFNLLCNEGVNFTSAYSDCPICVPARVSLMTGKYVTTHKMTKNGPTSKIMGRMNTLPTYMRDRGYQTAAIGKMHFKPPRTRHGFDEMILPNDYYYEMTRSGEKLQPMRHGIGQNELYPCQATVPESMTLTSWITEECVKYILERRDPTLPFFLWCSFSKPHPPLDPPEPYYSMYRNCDIPEPFISNWSEGNDCPEPFKRFKESRSVDLIPKEILLQARAAYYGLITQIDYNIGRIFSALQDAGMFDDTFIIYTSDHGEFLGDHNAGSKVFFYESSSHVPFVMRMPKSWGNRKHGTEVSSVVTHADILPTLLAATGTSEFPDDIDGQDLIALSRGQLEAPRIFLEGMTDDPRREYYALTDGKWKYIWYSEGGVEQLFDLVNDPKELNNLSHIKEYASKKAELKKELISRHENRSSNAVCDGKLVEKPIGCDSVRDRRNSDWPGFHTENFKENDLQH